MPVRLNQVKGLSEIRGLMSAFQGCGEPRVGGISHNPASCCFVLSSRAANSFSQRPRRGAVQRTPKLAAPLKAARQIRDEALTRPKPGRIQS